MQDGTDAVLARELKKIGDVLSGWVARRLIDNVGEVRLIIHLSPLRVLAQAQNILGDYDVLDSSVYMTGGSWTVSGVIMSGFAQMNPVAVTSEIRALDEEASTDVFIRAVAKEGLIKQRAGETGASKFAVSLVQACGPYPLGEKVRLSDT